MSEVISIVGLHKPNWRTDAVNTEKRMKPEEIHDIHVIKNHIKTWTVDVLLFKHITLIPNNNCNHQGVFFKVKHNDLGVQTN